MPDDQVTVKQLVPGKNQQELDLLLSAMMRIWNDPANHKYLSNTFIPYTEEQFRFWLTSHLEQDGYFFAALRGGEEVLGVAVVKVDPVFSFELMALGVSPDCQGQGIGGRLIQRTLDFAGERGFKAVEVSTFADNAKMLRLLIGLGFMPTHIDYHKRCDGVDNVRLRRYLS